MVIKEQTPLTLAEVTGLAGDSERAGQAKAFIKQFSKMKPEKAKEIRKDLVDLELLKLKEEHIVKIVDFMPEDAEDVIKILPEVSLNQDEINKILEAVKKH